MHNFNVCSGSKEGSTHRTLLRLVLVVTIAFNVGLWAFVWKLRDNVKTVEGYMDDWPEVECTLQEAPVTQVRNEDNYRIKVAVHYKLLSGGDMNGVAYNSYDQRYRAWLDEEYVNKYTSIFDAMQPTPCFYNPEDPKQVILEHQTDELTNHQYTFAYLVGFLGGSVGLCCCACYAWLLRDDIRAAEAARMEVEADENYQAPQTTGGGSGEGARGVVRGGSGGLELNPMHSRYVSEGVVVKPPPQAGAHAAEDGSDDYAEHERQRTKSLEGFAKKNVKSKVIRGGAI